MITITYYACGVIHWHVLMFLMACGGYLRLVLSATHLYTRCNLLMCNLFLNSLYVKRHHIYLSQELQLRVRASMAFSVMVIFACKTASKVAKQLLTEVHIVCP